MTVCPGLLKSSCLAIVLIVQVAWYSPAFSQGNSTNERRRAQFQRLRDATLQNLRHELAELSQHCHDQDLLQAAQDITAVSLELTNRNESVALPTMVQLPLGRRLPQWRTQLRTLRENRASELYSLARKALTAAKLPTLAYQLIKDTLRLNPDHADARAVLGLKLFRDPQRADDPTYAGEWVSPFEARKRSGSQPEINHPTFGWIPVRHVARYDQGERLYRARWVSAAKEEESRRDFKNAWEIPSEHFLVKTNTSLEEGVEISRKLEAFHSWLLTNFPAFFETPKSLVERFEQAHNLRRGGKSVDPMEVHYFASREEYDRTVRPKSELLARIVTNGLYWEDDRTCYFFRNPDDPNLDVVYHEATHQIFDLATLQDRRSASRKRQVVLREKRSRHWIMCEKSNFWMLEGIACYFESVVIDEGRVSVGDPKHKRFIAAQTRMFDQQLHFFVPLQVFCGLGKEQFKNQPNLAPLYTQASGVAHFLMHYQDGTYRDDFVTLLSAAYRPDLRNIMAEPSLEDITGIKYAVLDQQYREHMGNIAVEAGQLQAAQVQQMQLNEQ